MTHTEKTSTTCAVILHKSSVYKNSHLLRRLFLEVNFEILLKKKNKTKQNYIDKLAEPLVLPCKLTYSTFHFFFFCHQKLDFKTWRGYLNLNLTFMQIY